MGHEYLKSQASEEEKPLVVERIDKLDAHFQKGLVVMIFAVVSLNWFLMGIGQ